MKMLACTPAAIDLRSLIDDAVHGDYIYMYPPRQAYRPIDADALYDVIAESLRQTAHEPLNLYLHFPFCEQICTFCNLFTTRSERSAQDTFSAYVDRLLAELDMWAPLLEHRRVSTVYLGGGTPSLVHHELLDRCLSSIEEALHISRSNISEVAIEVAPDTVDLASLKCLRAIGITRVNMGLQATDDATLRDIGRSHGYMLARSRIVEAIDVGFDNVCVDLIYGLPGQSTDAWCRAVDEVASLGVDTICTYAFTWRPHTGVDASALPEGRDQYARYDYALQRLTAAGYMQETHVRYIKPGSGGYLQKENHWRGEDVVGLGAGARGYLRLCDYRNGYSVRHRRRALDDYSRRIDAGNRPFDSGIVLDRDDRMRRMLILGLFGLPRDSFLETFGFDVHDVFADALRELNELGLIALTDTDLRLTTRGRKYRDLVAQALFSNEVWNRVSTFDYDE